MKNSMEIKLGLRVYSSTVCWAILTIRICNYYVVEDKYENDGKNILHLGKLKSFLLLIKQLLDGALFKARQSSSVAM